MGVRPDILRGRVERNGRPPELQFGPGARVQSGRRACPTGCDLEVHHDDVLDGPHSLEWQDEPTFRIRLDSFHRHVLRREHEDVGQLPALRVHDEVLNRPQDLAVVRHDGLAPELRGKLLHPITRIGEGPLRHRRGGIPSLCPTDIRRTIYERSAAMRNQRDGGCQSSGGGGTIARMLLRYGRAAPMIPNTTETRRSHQPTPAPHDQSRDGAVVRVEPQNPATVNVPTSVVAAPGIATIGARRAESPTPTTRTLMNKSV